MHVMATDEPELFSNATALGCSANPQESLLISHSCKRLFMKPGPWAEIFVTAEVMAQGGV